MAIPDLLTDEQRIAYGFSLEGVDTARHVRYGVWRYRCSQCELWVRKVEQVYGLPVCLRCLAHHEELVAEPPEAHPHVPV
ncbi:MAG: hypothetical protein ACYC6Y_06920 [Thermoguttaceae bacterium]